MESLEFYKIYDSCGMEHQKVQNIINKDALQDYLKLYECTIEQSKSKEEVFLDELEMFMCTLNEEYDRLRVLEQRLKRAGYFDPTSVVFQINLCKKRISQLEKIIKRYQES